jgi:hypothetical protein
VPKLDNDRDLRIGAGAVDPVAAWRGQSPGATLGVPTSTQNTGDDHSLPPVPVVGASSPAPPAGTIAATGSIDQMMRYLETRGVKGFKLQMNSDTGQWRCTCAIPDPQNPMQKTTYDTGETGATDPLAALRAVVEEVERKTH